MDTASAEFHKSTDKMATNLFMFEIIITPGPNFSAQEYFVNYEQACSSIVG
jgi:hypothetical protein